MKYELAKALRDAGFPQPENQDVFTQGTYIDREGNNMYSAETKDAVFCPTLSELIEYLGDDFVNLYKTKDVFTCTHPYEDGEDTVGSTPWESVAKLCFALKQK